MSNSTVEVTTENVLLGALASVDQIKARRKDCFDEEVAGAMAEPRKRWPWSKPTYMTKFQAELWVKSVGDSTDMIMADWEILHDDELVRANQLRRAAERSAGPTMQLSVDDADLIARALESEAYRAKPKQLVKPLEGSIHDADRLRWLIGKMYAAQVGGGNTAWSITLPNVTTMPFQEFRAAIDKARGHKFEEPLALNLTKK